MARMIPVYLFTGFLDGGKTHMIEESMEDQRFNSGEKTLIIQCEEGEEELDLSRFYGKNVWLHTIENEEDLTQKKLEELSRQHYIDRVIIEYNGMWSLNTLYQNMPQDWGIYQEMMFAEASTFLAYNANMRQLMVDKLSNAEMIILTRTPEGIDKDAIHKVIRAITRRAAITYDYPDGHVEYDEVEDPLPFDVDAPVVKIEDRDYALWYRDMAEDLEKYRGKTVRFKGVVARDRSLGKNALLIGRHVMTCCAADIAYNGVICFFPEEVAYKTRDWLTVTATLELEEHKLYKKVGPILHATKWEAAEAPEDEVATFY